MSQTQYLSLHHILVLIMATAVKMWSGPDSSVTIARRVADGIAPAWHPLTILTAACVIEHSFDWHVLLVMLFMAEIVSLLIADTSN